MKQVAFLWDHPPLMPHRPWWQHPLQIVTFLLREFEGLRSSTTPGPFPALPSTPALCYAQLLDGTVPFRKQAYLFSSFTKFILFFFFTAGSDDRTQQAEEAGTPGYVL